jgi:hypothetical protein
MMFTICDDGDLPVDDIHRHHLIRNDGSSEPRVRVRLSLRALFG